MSHFVLSPAAQRDVEAIWDYTADRWSPAQADKYVIAIRNACRQLVQNTRPSEALDDVRRGYRKSATGSHVILFRTTDTGIIDIVRILHRRMDHRAHFHNDDMNPSDLLD